MLPLNGGHAIYVDADGRANDWLINCGNENAVNFTLKDFLRAQGVNTLPRLVLTEGDLKNVGGAQTLDELFHVGELWTSAVKFRSSNYRDTVAAFEKPTMRHKILNCGNTIGDWQVLFPNATDNFEKADDSSLVLRGNFRGTRVLLLSDLSRAGQSDLLATTNDLRADIVVAGLPTAGEPLCDALIDAIRHARHRHRGFGISRPAPREPRLARTAGAETNSRDLHAHRRRSENCYGQIGLEAGDDGRSEIHDSEVRFRLNLGTKKC